jgi:uncharacterized protein YebE (UPF0316 family)
METLLGALLIFGLRVVDVSLGTIRIVLLTRGSRWRAGALGFFESLTWVTAAGLVFNNLDTPPRLLAFAAGFATGTVLGATVERWLAVGRTMLRVVTAVGTPEVAPALRTAGFGVTVINAEGLEGEVRVAFSVIPRRKLPEAFRIVAGVNPDAFVTADSTAVPDARLLRAAGVRK